MLALIVTEETLIQMRANLSLLHLAKRRKKKTCVTLARAWEPLPSDLLVGAQIQTFLDRVW